MIPGSIVQGAALLAMDPGSRRSALVAFESDGKPSAWALQPNDLILAELHAARTDALLAIEAPRARGTPASNDLFDSTIWIGRFTEAWAPAPVAYVDRFDVKLALTGSVRAKDGDIRRSVIEHFGGQSSIGTKRAPGPLYGITADLWQAVAVGLVARVGVRPDGGVGWIRRSKPDRQPQASSSSTLIRTTPRGSPAG